MRSIAYELLHCCWFQIKSMTPAQIREFQNTNSIQVSSFERKIVVIVVLQIQGFDLTPEHITVTHIIKDLGDANLEATSQADVTVSAGSWVCCWQATDVNLGHPRFYQG